jgi:hypothetical protein
MRASTTPQVEISDISAFFGELESFPCQEEKAPPGNSIAATESELTQFLTDVGIRLERVNTKLRRIDRKLATGFNVFRLIEPSENRLSDIIADLLDPKGSHGQSETFLRLLFQRLSLPAAKDLRDIARVEREAPTHGIAKYRRRIDVLVDARALVAIENKVDSVEQDDQVRDYLEHLRISARSRSLKATLIYLTPTGRYPKSLPGGTVRELLRDGSLHCWNYHGEFRAWLEECHRSCEAERIRNFLSDFISYIESALVRESDNDNEISDEI